MPRKLFEKDIGELAFAFRYDKSWSQAFALQTQIGATVKGPTAHKTSLESEGRSQLTAERCRVPATSERLAGEEFL